MLRKWDDAFLRGMEPLIDEYAARCRARRHAAFRRYLRRGTYLLCAVAAVWWFCAR